MLLNAAEVGRVRWAVVAMAACGCANPMHGAPPPPNGLPADAPTPVSSIPASEPIDAGTAASGHAVGAEPVAASGSWWRTYAGTDSSARDSAVDVAVDARGRATVLANLAQRAFGVLAYEPDGTLAWASSFHDPADDADVPVRIATDASGNVYAAGTASRGSPAVQSYVIVSFDASGALRWSVHAGAGALSDLRVEDDGRAAATGVGSDGTHAVARTVALDAAGDILWQASEVGPLGLGAAGRHVALDTSRNAYVAGESTDGSHDQVTLFAYDPSGARRWMVRTNEDPTQVPQSTAQALALDSSGAPYVAVARAFRPTQDDEPTVELAAAKWDPAGSVLWTATVAVETRNVATAIAVDARGRATVTGFAGDPTPDAYLTAQFDPSGRTLWTNRDGWDAAGQHEARALAIDGAGDVHVTGTAYGPDGIADFGSIVYDASGAVISRGLDGDGADRMAAAAALALDGAFYVVGSTLASPRAEVGVLRTSP
ncbi:MAG TPA: hypothetical protein VKU41_29985 [Polyangiaceae bacterium]|nr:hypothetical protein [Polyangiaceae bacterium]